MYKPSWNNYCIDCGKLICNKSKMCPSCANKGKNNPMYGKPPWNYGLTKDDDKRLKNGGIKNSETTTRLYVEGKIESWNKDLTKENDERVEKSSEKCSKTKTRLYAEGKIKNPMFGKKRPDLVTLNKNLDFIEKRFKAMNIKPNKPEKLLNKLLQENFPNQFKYTGDGKVIIGRFNPDFICNQSKKIIEMYGDYFHNLPPSKERDERRLIAYTTRGYSTLILWEHELKNPNQVLNKINEFIGVKNYAQSKK